MAFGLDDAIINAAAETSKDVASELAENTKSELAKNFCSADFCDKSLQNEETPEIEQDSPISTDSSHLDIEFAPDKFDANSTKSVEEGISNDVREVSTDTSTRSIFEQNQFEEPSKGLCDNVSSNISFGNRYDDRTISFLNECKKYAIDLPTSVTHAGSHIDRHSNGGLLDIDKSIIKTTLDNALSNKKISKEVYDELRNKLMSC